MPLDLSRVVPIYQARIDELINQLGKSVTLYFKALPPIASTDTTDPMREHEARKPIYKETTATPAPAPATKTIKALLRYVPDGSIDEGTKTKYSQGRIMLKTYLTDVPDLKRCDYIIPQLDIDPVISSKYRLAAEPIPVGLQQSRYAITLWERV